MIVEDSQREEQHQPLRRRLCASSGYERPGSHHNNILDPWIEEVAKQERLTLCEGLNLPIREPKIELRQEGQQTTTRSEKNVVVHDRRRRESSTGERRRHS
jgi:hypothetical protein